MWTGGAPIARRQSNHPASRSVDAAVARITPTEQGIASRVLARNGGGNITLFAFDAGQGLTEHTSFFEALVLTLDGSLTLTIGGTPVTASPGTIVRMPANVPHAVDAPKAARMLLIMLRDPKEAAGTASTPSQHGSRDRVNLIGQQPIKRDTYSRSNAPDRARRIAEMTRGVADMAESRVVGAGLTRVLCVVVFIVMLAAFVYAAWIGVTNFSRIHV